jgi:hypothetical protein
MPQFRAELKLAVSIGFASLTKKYQSLESALGGPKSRSLVGCIAAAGNCLLALYPSIGHNSCMPALLIASALGNRASPGHLRFAPPLAIVSDKAKKDEWKQLFTLGFRKDQRGLLPILTSFGPAIRMRAGSVRAEVSVRRGPRLETYPEHLARHRNECKRSPAGNGH